MKFTKLVGITLFTMSITGIAWGQSVAGVSGPPSGDSPRVTFPSSRSTARFVADGPDSPATPPPAAASQAREAQAADDAIASPSDTPPPPAQEAPSVRDCMSSDEASSWDQDRDAALDACGAGNCECGGCGTAWFPCCPREAWKLPQPGFLQKHNIVLGGWLQQGITFNANNPDDGFNGPVATNDLASEYQMNQMWLYLHRPADNGGCGFAWGGHIDIMYGTDGRFGINKGLEDRIYGFHNETYGIVLPQFYLELAYNNLSVKLGHFAGILDYEMVPSPFNPFYSHSYSYAYTVPQLVTGALADYKLNDNWSIQGGAHRGWMQFEDYNDAWDVMAGIKWKSDDQRTELRYAVSSGKQSFPFDDSNRFVYSLVFQRQVTDALQYVLVQNAGVEQNPLGDGVDAEWYGVNQYLLYTINKCWSANARFEWMRDDDGMRIGGPGNIPGIRAWDGFGYAGNFFALTAGLNWRPTGNWLIRPEIRWDWYDGAPSWMPGKPALPFDAGDRDQQTTFAVDAILTF